VKLLAKEIQNSGPSLSESLSSISKRFDNSYCTRKLDNVIVNANITEASYKSDGPFQTKMHLESTEVDVIMKNRLLLKRTMLMQT
jgi:hypothetical protein